MPGRHAETGYVKLPTKQQVLAERKALEEHGIFPAKPVGNDNGNGGARRGHEHKTERQRQTEYRELWLSMSRTKYRRMLKKVWAAAEAGEPWAVLLVRDQTAGKPAQAVEIKAEEGYLPLVVGMPPGVVDVVEGEARELPPGPGPDTDPDTEQAQGRGQPQEAPPV